ncbi:MerR family transcriptional regulator [Microbacterium lacticum]|uniref:MerR family transcriptional regulator n=1 Tax=Microbacterium lacticum TaxID=33885 RepID=UPI0018B0A516|nr:MerR family transcriptional regulator [Microbacterium lacticum]MBF9336197.1 MerR family transcriptional regulator [Microbacterium lacticum]
MLTSNKLAQLAGTTVRTLRHYHAVGVLEEPPRGPNGYRRYGVQDLITVLRIRRMSSLGLSLDQIRWILTSRSGGDTADIDAELDALDASLAGQLERLQEQRQLIARIRSSETEPDLPPELTSVFRLLEKNNVDAASIEGQKQLAVLVAHLRPADGVRGMRDLLTAMGSSNRLQTAIDLSNRIQEINDSTAEATRAQLLEELVVFLAPVANSIPQRRTADGDDNVLQTIVESISFEPYGMNPAQAELIRSLTEHLKSATGQLN